MRITPQNPGSHREGFNHHLDAGSTKIFMVVPIKEMKIQKRSRYSAPMEGIESDIGTVKKNEPL